MTQTQRLFIAIELPEAIRQDLKSPFQMIKSTVPENTVRWVNLDTLHMTLKFLGDVLISSTADIENRLSHVVTDYSPFEITIEGVGCFPNKKNPRVIWMGIPDSRDHIHALRDSVETYIAPLGYPTEDRPFRPHLTLGRVRRSVSNNKQDKIGRAIEKTRLEKTFTWQCTAISLMKSELKPTGAEYTCLRQFTLTN